MDILAEARRRAFSLWLRTGRLPGWLRPRPAELKFNPWHDPDDGRFTFAGTGRYFGRGGSGAEARHSDDRRRPGPAGGGRRSSGGGSPKPFGGYGGGRSGGGGASGSWDSPPAGAPPRTAARPARPLRPGGRTDREGPAPAAKPQPSRPERQRADRVAPAPTDPSRNWQRVERNGYEYRIDEHGRTRRVSGTLTLNEAQSRSRTQQARAGGEDRRASDDGGHYIARRFNGPTEAFNHFAQDANFNRGDYRSLENQWAGALRVGKRVEVVIKPIYRGSSQRPSTIVVQFRIDETFESHSFPNEPKGDRNAK